MSRGDRALGIVLGIIVGLAIVAVFVFVFSEDTIDSSQLEDSPAQEDSQPEPGR
jgi:uncharacterized membrane protein required for colicin V production